jgi:stage II sporulation protein Q
MHRAPTESRAHFHDGVDYMSASQTPVRVTRAGLISSVKSIGDDRFEVEVNHGDGFVSSYEGVSDVQVQVGDPVEQGVAIGNTSSSSNRHGDGLHFEIRHKGRSIDPGPLLNK